MKTCLVLILIVATTIGADAAPPLAAPIHARQVRRPAPPPPVYRETAQGVVPRAVRVGARSDSLIEIVQGLQPGDEVVASATYLLDSESNLAAAIQGLMLQMGMGLNMGGMEAGKGDGGRVRRP